MRTIERTSALAAPAAEVWDAAVTPEGINDELSPVLRMTVPPRLRGKTIADVSAGEALGRSWILLGGVVPIDFDDLCLAELEPGRRFKERSRTLAFAVWQHERIVAPASDGTCSVSDRLGFELRRGLRLVPGGERLAAAIVAALFSHRHRRLRRRHG